LNKKCPNEKQSFMCVEGASYILNIIEVYIISISRERQRDRERQREKEDKKKK